MATANSKLKIDFGYDSYGTSNVHGDMDITGSLSIGGSLSFTGTTVGNFIPDQDQRNLGNTSNRWSLVGYSANLAGTLTVSGSASLQDSLSVTSTISGGNTTIAGFANISTSVNSALLTVGTSFIANTTGAYHTGTINASSITLSNSSVIGIVSANNSGVYPTSNTAGSELGTASRRWVISGNTGNFSDQLTVSGNTTLTGNATLNGTLQTISGNVDIDSGTLFVDSNNNRVGINNSAPTVAFYVVGDANVTSSVNSALLTVGSDFIANTSGAYHTGLVNAASHRVGSNFIANSSAITSDGVANLISSTSTIRVGNSSVNSFVNSSAVLTGVGIFSVGANVGSNVSLSNTSLSIGNSTSNSVITNSLLSISNSTSTANVSPSNLIVGASVVNSTGVFVGVGNFTSAANVGSNVSINTSTIFVGNSTSNLTASFFSIRLSDPTSTANLTANNLQIGSMLVNSSVITINTGNFSTGANVGSNVNITSSSLQIGNSTVNTQVNSSVFSTGTGNFSIAANVGSNVKLTTVLLSIGNSTVNSSVNSTVIFSTGSANISTSVNSAVLTVGTSFVANTTGAYHGGVVNAASFTTSGVTSNTSGVYPSSNTVGNALGSTTSRWNIVANTGSFSGAVTAATASNTTFDTTLATTEFVKNAILNAIYPIGSIYTNASNSTNPATLLGFGTWTAFGAGRVAIGFDSTNTLFDTAEETGGTADAIVVSHTHTANSTVTDPGHFHNTYNSGSIGNNGGGQALTKQAAQNQSVTTATTGISVSTTINSTGSSGTNANYPPYITVYMWKRTA